MLHFAYFLVEFRGNPPREPPVSLTQRNSSHNKLGGRKAHTSSYSTVKWGYALPFPAVPLFVLSSFLPPVRALLCGRLPHIRPRSQSPTRQGSSSQCDVESTTPVTHPSRRRAWRHFGAMLFGLGARHRRRQHHAGVVIPAPRACK